MYQRHLFITVLSCFKTKHESRHEPLFVLARGIDTLALIGRRATASPGVSDVARLIAIGKTWITSALADNVLATMNSL